MFANSFKLMSALSSINKDILVTKSMAIFDTESHSSLVFWPLGSVLISDATQGLY